MASYGRFNMSRWDFPSRERSCRRDPNWSFWRQRFN